MDTTFLSDKERCKERRKERRKERHKEPKIELFIFANMNNKKQKL